MGASHRNETALVHAITRALRHAYPSIWVVKVHGGPYQAAGIPDLLCCIDGRLVALEAKHKKAGESEAHARGRTTPRQRRVLDDIRAAGGAAAVVLTVEEALLVIESVLSV